ncbi:alanine racemase [Jatrophihabitans sp.]|uniref:alanine racemase n=1 Tax=Jatrophihabitans sp. TaxID=1932789 RepID=UPI002D15E629|nr:alanine racemase [Jatrophihabitans sp.]
MPHTEAVVDLAAIAANVATLRSHTAAELMAVVKADGYGHGMVPAARAALAGGAGWLGVAMLDEALALRAAGIDAPVLAWLWTPREAEALRAVLAAGVDVSVSSGEALDLVVATATELGSTARVHLKIDTGLSRNGCTAADWPALLEATAKAAATGAVETTGVWSHFASADSPGDPSVAGQLEAYGTALAVAREHGVVPRLRHLANSAATLTLPQSHFDLVRAGIAVYGLSPVPGRGNFGLVPAMTLRTSVAGVKRVPAGAGVSYGHAYVTERETTLALVPVGYADGVPRAAGNTGPVAIGGSRYTVSGRVCMDQFVVDVGDAEVSAGDEVVLFGPGFGGEPTAQDWADVLDTIHYEIVTRVGPRVPRSYTGGAA